MFGMLVNCESLKKIEFLGNVNLACMENMFYNCISLEYLNILNFNTYKVNNMSYMFLGCSSLKELSLKNFGADKVINMGHMFF